MRNAKLVLAACAAALALSAVVATAASAAGWMVGGTSLVGSAGFSPTAAVEKSLILEAKGVFTITCKGSTYKGGNAELVAPNKLKASFLEFTQCNGGEGEACQLNDETISTVPVVAESVLDGSLAATATIKPQTKNVIATVDFIGEKCVLTGVVPVTGSVLVLSPTAQDERTTQQSIAKTTEASGELKVGSFAASVATTATSRLASGQAWSFL